MIGIIGHAILRLPQEDVATLFADDACQKLPARGEKRDVHTALHAGTHQGGTCAGVGETENALERVQREARDFLLLAADDDIFAVYGEIRVFAEHEQGVEQLSHGVSSSLSKMWARRYETGSARLHSTGRQIDFNEQALQCLPGLTFGV